MLDLDLPCAYAGIGARRTPHDVLDLMRSVGARLAERGCILRSGGALGADSAFECGARITAQRAGRVELFLPWAGYNDRRSSASGELPVRALELAEQHHPAWDRCSRGVQRMHARNAQVVLGEALDDPVRFVVCYTPDARAGGGTGQALRIAHGAGIPVHDLADPAIRERLEGWLET